MDHNVTEFRGTFYYLSNMYPCKIKLGNVTYECAEAAFQAAKLEDKSQRKMFAGLNGYEARKLGRQVKLRPYWNNVKVRIMNWVIAEKFAQNPTLKLKLLETRGMQLIEGNTWGDTFWGVCNGNGQNQLGKLLMQYRDWQYEKTVDNVSIFIGYTRITKTEVPETVKAVVKKIYYEEEKDLKLLKFQWLKGEYYAYEERVIDNDGEEYHLVYLISEDGTARMSIELDW